VQGPDVPRDAAGNLLEPTDVISDAHEVGLKWSAGPSAGRTLPAGDYRIGADPAGTGDLAGEIITRSSRPGGHPFFNRQPDMATYGGPPPD
jgi:glycerophosphoryl diester phosphodiesterase